MTLPSTGVHWRHQHDDNTWRPDRRALIATVMSPGWFVGPAADGEADPFSDRSDPTRSGPFPAAGTMGKSHRHERLADEQDRAR